MTTQAIAKVPKAALKLPGLPGHPVPYTEVDLQIIVDDGNRCTPQCVPPQWVQKHSGTWRRMSLVQIVHWGTVHFQGMRIKVGTNETRIQARMRKVWQELVDHNPRPVAHNGHDRLVLDRDRNSDEQGDCTEVLGDAIGVAIVAKIVGTKLSGVTKRNFSKAVRHDFDLVSKQHGTIKLETRGRFNRDGRKAAMEEVDDKFGRQVVKKRVKGFKHPVTQAIMGTGDYSRAIGALVYPSDNPKRAYCDVELMDPEGDARAPTELDLARRLHEHYLGYFLKQNVGVARYLVDLLALPDDELHKILAAGDQTFVKPGNYPPRRTAFMGRIKLRVLREEFLGTYFDDATRLGLPQIQATKQNNGIFFYGLWRRVIERLGSYRILELLDVVGETTTRVGRRGTTFVLFDDGLLTAWAASSESLRADSAGE